MRNTKVFETQLCNQNLLVCFLEEDTYVMLSFFVFVFPKNKILWD